MVALAAWQRRGATPPLVRATYALMVVLLGAYLVALLVEDAQPVFNDWEVAGFEIAGSAVCIVRGLTRRHGRIVPLTLGLGLMMWSLGDLVLTVESRNGGEPATPSWADLCYLGFFPLTYIAVVVFLRGEIRHMTTPNWLDGAVAGTGVAAACAAFAFHGIARSTGGGLAETATNLAYPVADLLLLGLAAGGMTLMSDRDRTRWLLMVFGIAINVIGDTANLFSDSLGRTGFVLDAMAWPTSIMVMSVSVWVRQAPTDLLAAQKPSTFVIPGLSATCAVVVLVVGTRDALSEVAVGLATLTLALAGLRLARSARAIQVLSQQRRDLSITDHLTGLRNRRYLHSVLDAYFAEYEAGIARRTLAFLFVDLNHFKEINDTFGHPAGDQLLTRLGPRLQACLRADDLLVRLGGDEFAVVLLDGSAELATTVARRITDAICEPFSLGVVQASVAASIGIAIAPEDAVDGTSLIWCADVAMYRAKLGNLPFASYQQDLDRIGDRVALLAELQTAIDEHQLLLYYQPQLDLKTGRIDSVEGLIRWMHPTMGVLPPAEFLPFAEDAGLMGPITELALADAIAQCAAWHADANPLTVSVNITAPILVEPGFTRSVCDLLAQHGLPSSALTLEITETSVISDFERTRQAISELSDFGVGFSIDDFGAGFTSLTYLSDLAATELKLDRSFITGLAGAGQRDVELVRATISLGHALGLRIVAEGIEDEATMRLLTDLGCDLGQGYLIGLPKPAHHLHFRTVPRGDDVPAALLSGATGR